VYLDVTFKIRVLRLGHYILDETGTLTRPSTDLSENVYRKKLFEFLERVSRVLALEL
jgi:hypothetical protein